MTIIDAQGRTEPSRAELVSVLGALMLALFAAFITGTVVTVALPRTVTELGGDQVQYNWIITALGLAATATTPVWGRLSDSFDKKTLTLTALGIFGLASIGCALVQDPVQLIIGRALQGVGVGGVQTLVLIVIAAYLPPRRRVRYNGIYSAVVACATVAGPLVGGLLTDAPGFGWRSTFWFGVPFCALAFAVLLVRLKLPDIPGGGRMNYLTSTMIVAGIGGLLIWISFGGVSFEWVSVPSFSVLLVSLAVLCSGVVRDARADTPIIPYRLYRQRNPALIVLAALSLGLTMQAAGVFLAQYLQIGRDMSAFVAGAITVPSALATLVASTLSGRWSSRTGRLKGPLIVGMSLIFGGNLIQSFLTPDTPLWTIVLALVLSGAGVGLSLQNTLIAIQNSVGSAQIGTASSSLTFIRSMGGTVGFQILGSLFALHIASTARDSMLAAGQTPPAGLGQLSSVAGIGGTAVRSAYATETHWLYLVASVGAGVALVALGFLRTIRLRDTLDSEKK